MAKKESDPWSLEERVRKRRKLDSEVQGQSSTKGKDDWDDSMELTQAELETLDVIASQAIVEVNEILFIIFITIYRPSQITLVCHALCVKKRGLTFSFIRTSCVILSGFNHS